ncbi:transcriptional regulator Spx [Lactococcus cremoris]|uniref:Spx/MgsR family RNA polymerase-binding regulatory protein n=1 Tax=Lactococcus lactis subsp. cremoris TaxID=1359 RepID=UPI00038B4D75|nr:MULTISPECIES: Spx/MgsR family RNA polymerase-binding regulatory protein [Lactococcus]EQC55402.1 ArsR family transcriptional regulator [Lactococcus cremoris subsp. cremoris TIFN5]EQC87817.1 ArsR family transcriptional regulator [Lactococcus cremoris subsp. cremoris TIFN1]AXN65318.1 Arsenate reductase related protein glutaredoxin family [Lactococcus cremoris]KZK47584.1 Regulatory protein spx [Lactococcus cremoris]MRM51781.1 Spx/MgsR family RNA polymerase-binding regulatory protein [Lactococcu
MIKIYLSGSCLSCRKAKKWLRKRHIEFEEINLTKDIMEKDDLIKILSLTENGLEDVIATRGKTYSGLNHNFDELGLEEAYRLIQENPRLLKRPLIFDEQRLLIGFNEDGIRAFIPPEVRRVELRERLILI